MDPRATFFLGAAALAAVLAPVAESEVRWVPQTVAVTYLVLALVSWLDWRSANRR